MKKREYLKVSDALKKCDHEICSLTYKCFEDMQNAVLPLADEDDWDEWVFFGVDFVEDTPQNRETIVKALYAQKIHFLTECGKLFDTAIASLNCDNK